MAENNSILLSICIPTYNRAQLLKEAIESVLAQIDETNIDKIEIVVSDNASTDETDVVVNNIIKNAKPAIKYFMNGNNVGMDNNCQLLVERACGRYVWLLGSDDLLSSGALKRVLRELAGQEQVDLYLGEKEDFYLTPDQSMRKRKIIALNKEAVFDFSRKEIVDRYFMSNKKLIAYCNFISNIIFKREKWLNVKNKQKFVGTFYLHLYVFQSLLWGSEPGIMKYLPVLLVKRRWGNDRTHEFEQYKSLPFAEVRLRQDVFIYRQISSSVFDDKKYVRLIDEMVVRNDVFSWAVRVKITARWRFYFKVFPFLWGFYWSLPVFWVKIVPLLFIPNIILMIMRASYRKLVKGELLSAKELLEA